MGGSTTGQSINLELGSSATTLVTLNNAAVRTLAGKSSGAITIPTDFYGRSSATPLSTTFSSPTADATVNVSGLSGYVAGSSNITITVNSGVYLYSTSVGNAGLTITGGQSGDTIRLVNNGYIMGKGGTGGTSLSGCSYTAAGNGGNAVSIGYCITIDNTNSGAYIGGGGGGGGGFSYGGWNGGGGGGAGGGDGGQMTFYCCGITFLVAGGGGGSAGNTGGDGSNTMGCGATTGTASGGGGGGRIFPGTGGVGKNTANASGGGAGGAGSAMGCTGFPNSYCVYWDGGSGGSANSAGGSGHLQFDRGSAGGGGGWGASGGTGGGGGGAYQAGGSGGKAVAKNGHAVTWVGGCTTRVYGAVS